MSGPRVSVVIAAYNSESYVASAVESALAQTYHDVEVIVVDDGSTDRTPEVLEQFGNLITVVKQENRGIGGARNAGVRAATGEVIALLDADDEWLPERVARCVDLLRARPDVGFVTTDAILVDDDGIPTGETHLDQVPFPRGEFAAEIVQRNFIWSGAFVRRSVLDGAGHFDESRPLGADDYDMWLRLIAAGVTPGIVREPLARYRVRADSVSRRDGKLLRARNQALARHLPAFWRQGVYGPGYQALHVAMMLARQGDWRTAARFASASMKDPDRSLPGVVVHAARKASSRARARVGRRLEQVTSIR